MAGHQWGPHMLRIRGQRKQLPGNVLEGEDWAVNLRYGQQIQRALCSLNHHDE